MKTIITTFSITIILLIVQGRTICFAQQPDTVSIREMQKLEALQGKWSGSGWYQMGRQDKHQINQTEHVYTKLDGRLLVIDGLGKDPQTGEVVFGAFGVIHYSPEKGLYQFNTYTNEGKHTLASAKLEGSTLTWWFDTPQGATIKYVIDFTSDTWVEDGLYSPDGKQWYPFFHMDLKKL